MFRHLRFACRCVSGIVLFVDPYLELGALLLASNDSCHHLKWGLFYDPLQLWGRSPGRYVYRTQKFDPVIHALPGGLGNGDHFYRYVRVFFVATAPQTTGSLLSRSAPSLTFLFPLMTGVAPSEVVAARGLQHGGGRASCDCSVCRLVHVGPNVAYPDLPRCWTRTVPMCGRSAKATSIQTRRHRRGWTSTGSPEDARDPTSRKKKMLQFRAESDGGGRVSLLNGLFASSHRLAHANGAGGGPDCKVIPRRGAK